MTSTADNPELSRKQVFDRARASFTGHQLTRSQFNEGMAITSIIKQGIDKNTSFHEKLTDYSHAFARSERFDALKGENIVRDLFKARYGQTMNQMREAIIKREETLSPQSVDRALHHAKSIEPMIRDGKTMPFYQAYDRAGRNLAKELQISELGAKDLMKEAYHDHAGKELYDWGKDLEAQHHTPVKEAERAARSNQRQNTRSDYGNSSYGGRNRFRSRKRA